ncbi:MAG: DUF202 domain-containing protein, partial [Proteobacteria bacterium]|nr:DUF202 domain-containing protein [Pseudomonadota bacterium]
MIASKEHLIHDRRVRLANIRTFLAFIRTSIACWGLGAAFFHLLKRHPYKDFGLFFIGLGFVILFWGIAEFVFVQKHYMQDVEGDE